jgi:hypothetical protein
LSPEEEKKKKKELSASHAGRGEGGRGRCCADAAAGGGGDRPKGDAVCSPWFCLCLLSAATTAFLCAWVLQDNSQYKIYKTK